MSTATLHSTGSAAAGTSKAARHRAILELVRTRSLRTQQELAVALRSRRIEATQATISRDVHELGLLRVPSDEGVRYVVAAAEVDEQAAARRLRAALREHLLAVEFIDLLGVMHTQPSTAPLVAAAMDGARFAEVAGTVAGDDTVLVVSRSRPAAQRLAARLRHIAEETA